MAAEEKKRQKKLARRTAKRKQRQKTLIKQSQRGLRERLAMAVNAPVLHSELSETVWQGGFGYALLSRELPNGNVAYAVFLVDLSCLGVKDGFGDVISRAEYNRMRSEIAEHYELTHVSPADVRNLVERAVEYARDLGLEPHADYARLNVIFGDIDPADGEEHFQCGGENGKPMFTAGPNDTPGRCARILGVLERNCGKDGFNFMVPFPEVVPESLRHEARVIEVESK